MRRVLDRAVRYGQRVRPVFEEAQKVARDQAERARENFAIFMRQERERMRFSAGPDLSSMPVAALVGRNDLDIDSIPEALSEVMQAACNYEIVGSRENKESLEVALNKYKMAVTLTVATQVVAMPALNLLIARNQGQDYWDAITTRISTPLAFYNTALRNTLRRAGSSIGISSFSSAMGRELDLSDYQVATVSTVLETSLALFLGEMNEKKTLAKGAAQVSGHFCEEGFKSNVRTGKLQAAILTRNSLFSAAVFLVDPIAEVMSEELSEMLEGRTGKSKSEIKVTAVKALRFVLTMASVIPENIANSLASGKSLDAIRGEAQWLKKLTRGALARGVYGTIAAWAISTAFRIAEEDNKKEGGLSNADIVEITLNELIDMVPLVTSSEKESVDNTVRRVAEIMADSAGRFLDGFVRGVGEVRDTDFDDWSVEGREAVQAMGEVLREAYNSINMPNIAGWYASMRRRLNDETVRVEDIEVVTEGDSKVAGESITLRDDSAEALDSFLMHDDPEYIANLWSSIKENASRGDVASEVCVAGGSKDEAQEKVDVSYVDRLIAEKQEKAREPSSVSPPH